MAARCQSVNARSAQAEALRAPSSKRNFEFNRLLSLPICAYLLIHLEKSLALYFDGVNHADHGGVDRRIRSPNGSHRGEAFRSEQDAVADASIHGVEREDGIAAIRTVKLKRLDDEDLVSIVGRDFLRRDNVSDYAANEHTEECMVES
jgi:hypothetical protein